MPVPVLACLDKRGNVKALLRLRLTVMAGNLAVALVIAAYLISDHFSPAQVFRFVAMAIFGNLVVGFIFVAPFNDGYVRLTLKEPHDR